MQKDYEITRTQWNGIMLEIRWSPSWVCMDDGQLLGHLVIETVAPARAPLPITNTGYRSHFVTARELAREGGPEGYVEAWLADAAKSWRHDTAQLSLF